MIKCPVIKWTPWFKRDLRISSLLVKWRLKSASPDLFVSTINSVKQQEKWVRSHSVCVGGSTLHKHPLTPPPASWSPHSPSWTGWDPVWESVLFFQLYEAHIAYPDFLRNSTAAWWKEKIKELYSNPQEPKKSLKFDGLWIVSASLVGFLWKC